MRVLQPDRAPGKMDLPMRQTRFCTVAVALVGIAAEPASVRSEPDEAASEVIWSTLL